jgi:hypothetical protein
MHKVEKDLKVGRIVYDEQLDLGPRENTSR